MGAPSKFDYYFSPGGSKKWPADGKLFQNPRTPSIAPGATQYFFKIYLFYENWSTQTFRNGGLKKWTSWSIRLHF
jgi:hypothetical protein